MLDKTKNSQLEPQDFDAIGGDFSSKVQRITQSFLSEVQLHDLAIMQRQEKFKSVCAEQERMHKHLMNRVINDPPKEGTKEEYIKFLEKKNLEFGQHVVRELDKMNKQRGESQAIKDRCCSFLQKLFDRKIDLLLGKNPPFNFEAAVKAIRAEAQARFFGAPREHASVQRELKWPYFEAFRNPAISIEEQEAILSEIKITKVEWATSDTIKSLKFQFSNGQDTAVMGERSVLNNQYTFPSNVEIGQIVVGVRDSGALVDFLAFFDRQGVLLVRIEGDRKLGAESIIELS